MALEEQINKYRALDEWFNTPQGICVAHAFVNELNAVSDFFSGKRLIQLGNCGDNLWLPSLRFRQKSLITPCRDTPNADLFSSLHYLPIDKNSVDCIIAPLTLEAFAHDKSPIDEFDRILKPMGYIVFLGINPWSFWGAALRWGRLACFGDASATLSSSLSIKHAMTQRGYSQCMLRSFYYIPPVASEYLIEKLSFFNEMGKMLWPFPAGFYCYIVQKHQPCSPTPLFDAGDGLSFSNA